MFCWCCSCGLSGRVVRRRERTDRAEAAAVTESMAKMLISASSPSSQSPSRSGYLRCAFLPINRVLFGRVLGLVPGCHVVPCPYHAFALVACPGPCLSPHILSALTPPSSTCRDSISFPSRHAFAYLTSSLTATSKCVCAAQRRPRWCASGCSSYNLYIIAPPLITPSVSSKI